MSLWRLREYTPSSNAFVLLCMYHSVAFRLASEHSVGVDPHHIVPSRTSISCHPLVCRSILGVKVHFVFPIVHPYTDLAAPGRNPPTRLGVAKRSATGGWLDPCRKGGVRVSFFYI